MRQELRNKVISLHLLPNFDKRLLPVPAWKYRDWWQDNDKTRNHAQHCHPLAMANSLGYYVLSPATFVVEWNGDVRRNARIEIVEASSHCDIGTHAAYGSFTIQPGFVPMTSEAGDFIFVKGMPNERGLPYHCMEALIEAWWNPARFGLVFLLNQRGKFRIKLGQPIAQMFVYGAAGGFAEIRIVDGLPDEHRAWEQRRYRPGYAKDFDYMGGRHPNGHREPTHIVSWRKGKKFIT